MNTREKRKIQEVVDAELDEILSASDKDREHQRRLDEIGEKTGKLWNQKVNEAIDEILKKYGSTYTRKEYRKGSKARRYIIEDLINSDSVGMFLADIDVDNVEYPE